MLQYLNKKRCSDCKGLCCKRNGCMYLPEDFSSMEYESLFNVINEGNISINVSIFDFFASNELCKKYNLFNETPYEKSFWSYYLYLRARNINNGIISFFEDESPCSMLDDKGCKYSDNERPSLGLSLVPEKRKGEGCKQIAYKYIYEVMYDWIKYQDVLEKIVLKVTGKSSWNLLVEKSELDPTGYLSLYFKKIQEYVNPSDGIKIKFKQENIIIDETANVKKLILGRH